MALFLAWQTKHDTLEYEPAATLLHTAGAKSGRITPPWTQKPTNNRILEDILNKWQWAARSWTIPVFGWPNSQSVQSCHSRPICRSCFLTLPSLCSKCSPRSYSTPPGQNKNKHRQHTAGTSRAHPAVWRSNWYGLLIDKIPFKWPVLNMFHIVSYVAIKFSSSTIRSHSREVIY